MPASEYPTIFVGGPQPLVFERLADDYKVVEGPDFPDGGQDTFSAPGVEPVRRWRLSYRGNTPEDVRPIDEHRAEARGNHLAFDMRDREGMLFTGVKYESFEAGHEGSYWFGQFREVRLIQRP